MKRNGQAALEYLITYGWGFVIILVVVGALAYLGFLNPSRYVPARCDFGSQLQCADYKLQEVPNNNGKVYLRFRNNYGDNINIVSITAADNDGSGQSVNTLIKKGNTSDPIIYTVPYPLTKDDRISVPLIITFQRNTDGPLHNVTGEIFATVQ